jgi:hypothetical protein
VAGKRESPRMRKLRRALEEAGHTGIKLRWEPIGPALEMCGHSGGYIFESKQTRSHLREMPSIIPLGLSCAEALARVPLWAVTS